MKQNQTIPFYGPDGTSLGSRTPEVAKHLVANGHVQAAHGRKGHLKAIFLPREDGSNPVKTHARAGSRYSFQHNLANGHRCWSLKQLDHRDDDGVPVRTCGAFLQVVKDCLVERGTGTEGRCYVADS